MSERSKNTWKRTLVSYNPNFRIDTANPQMGQSGTDVYKIYGVTDNGDSQSSISLSSSGVMEVLNDRTIVISGGTVNNEGEEDVVIIGQNGNISISAPNGKLRILAKDIMLDAERDLHLKAGRNINIKAVGGKITQESQKQDIIGTSGNLITQLGMDFATQVFEGSFVGGDFLGGIIGPIAGNIVNDVLDTATGGLVGGIGGVVGNVAGGVLGGGLGGIVGDVAGGALSGGLAGAAGGLVGNLGDRIAGDVAGDIARKYATKQFGR